GVGAGRPAVVRRGHVQRSGGHHGAPGRPRDDAAARSGTNHGESAIKMMQSIRLAALWLALAVPALAQQATEENGHVLNFKDADIRSLITAVADMTGRSIIVDPQVSGQVTVISSQPLDDDEVWEVFQSILRVHGYTAVSDENTVRVLPDVNARQDGRVPVDDMRGGGDEPLTRIIQLEHVDAGKVSQLLRQLLPQSAYMVHHESSNS